MSTYRREHYLAKLRPFYNDSGLIKVITGIRRCGKSSLLITVLNELFEQGIPETNLIYLNLDRREYRNVTTPDQLDANEALYQVSYSPMCVTLFSKTTLEILVRSVEKCNSTLRVLCLRCIRRYFYDD